MYEPEEMTVASGATAGTQRVLWVIKGLGPGGAENLLLAAAAAHDPSQFTVEVAYLLPWKDHLVPALEAHGVRATCLDVRNERDVRWVARLRHKLATEPVDVVHAHSPYAAAFTRLAVRSLPRAKRPLMITTEHNPWTTFKAPTRFANAWTARLDDATFAVSAETLDSMSPRVRERAEVLVHGIDTAGVRSLLSQRAAVRAELGVADDVFLVGTVANYHPKKDWPNLLRTARAVADRGLPIRFCAVGQGPLEAEVQALHRELGLEDVVILTGYRADAVRLMAGCDAFALASKWEGLPVALMEASALGLPIVATDVGGIPDTFRSGVDALLVPSGNPQALAEAIIGIAGDPAWRRHLGQASARKASAFDAARAVRRIEATYAGLPA